MITIVFFLLYMVFGSMLRGWVFSILWSWFFVPLGLPDIGVAHAIGISMLVSFLTYQQQEDQKDGAGPGERAITVCLVGVFQAFMVLGMGWVVHSFMVVP